MLPPHPDEICNLAGGIWLQNRAIIVHDMLFFDTVPGRYLVTKSLATIISGCSNYQSGDLTKPERADDGIFGFGQHGLSVVSQMPPKGSLKICFSGPSAICHHVLKSDLMAPNSFVLASWPSVSLVVNEGSTKLIRNFNILYGTSMACPHAVGVAALMKAVHPE